jgi:hypothetical protein
MLWIEDIVENTPTPPFVFINFGVDMAGFVDPHKVVVRRSAFSAIPRAQNGDELEDGLESGRLKCQFSQVEGVQVQEIPQPIPIPEKRTLKEKGSCVERPR